MVPFVFGHIQPLDSINLRQRRTECILLNFSPSQKSFHANSLFRAMTAFLDSIYDHEKTAGIPLYPKERRQDIEITLF